MMSTLYKILENDETWFGSQGDLTLHGTYYAIVFPVEYIALRS